MILRYLRKLLSWQPKPMEHGVWPVRSLEGRPPKVSDKFGRKKRSGRGHLGVDIMYRRPKKGTDSRPTQTKWYECPEGVEAIACATGDVVRVVNSSAHGIAVYIQHGRYMSVYRHLSTTFVEKGDRVPMMQRVGIIGHAPSAGDHGINHLHFEIWDTELPGGEWSRRRKAVDPGPFLRRWVKI